MLARNLRAACARLERILSCQLLIVEVMTAEALASFGVWLKKRRTFANKLVTYTWPKQHLKSTSAVKIYYLLS